MSWRALATLVAALATTTAVQAEDGPRLSLSPLPGKAYSYELRLTSIGDEKLEVVFDPRRLKITIATPARGVRHVCRHPQAAMEAKEERSIKLEGRGQTWTELIDLTEYCYSEALEALQAGGTIEAEYGSASAVARIEVEATTVQTNAGRPSRPNADLVRVRLGTTTARTPEALRFRVSLRSKSGAHWIYPRLDLWRFRVQGPEGTVECGPRRDRIKPIVDFYRRISPRRPWRETLVASYVCPDVFDAPGVYEVTPIVDLLYTSPSEARRALTGTFYGPPSKVRLLGPRGARPRGKSGK